MAEGFLSPLLPWAELARGHPASTLLSHRTGTWRSGFLSGAGSPSTSGASSLSGLHEFAWISAGPYDHPLRGTAGMTCCRSEKEEASEVCGGFVPPAGCEAVSVQCEALSSSLEFVVAPSSTAGY